MYGPYEHAWMWSGGVGLLFGGLWLLLMWGVPVLVIVALLKYLFGKSPANRASNEPVPKTALDILKEAYARGDIDRQEFLQKRDDLEERG